MAGSRAFAGSVFPANVLCQAGNAGTLWVAEMSTAHVPGPNPETSQTGAISSLALSLDMLPPPRPMRSCARQAKARKRHHRRVITA
jgi:hypothetical protein